MKEKIISKVTSSVLLCTMVAYTTPIFAYTKDETVYSKIDTTGSSYDMLVNSHIINDTEQNLINDLSDLTNIKNVNGDEKFTQNGNSLIWEANGSDIYYQGETKKDLPIECKVKYELDGTEISSKDIVGKSGKVKIKLEYINKDAHTVNINGKSEILYTPFVVVCGAILDNSIHRNVEISSGKIVDDGTKTIAVGLAFPGLSESLNLSKNGLDIPSYIELTMDSKDFEFGNIASFITPKIFEESDLSIFDDLNKIYGKVNTLQSSSKELVKGATTLKSGTDTYLENSKMFNSAVKQVSIGASKVNSGYLALDNGIKTLAKNTDKLNMGAKQISDGTKALDNVLGPALSELSSGLDSLQNGALELQNGTNRIIAELDKSIAAIEGSTSSDISLKVKDLTTLVEANRQTISALKSVNSSLEKQLEVETDENIIASIKKQENVNNTAISVLSKDIDAMNETINTLSSTNPAMLKTLKNKLTALNQGIGALNLGITKIVDGTSTLNAGSSALASNIKALAEGANNLYEGTSQIADGINTLDMGSNEIKNGLSSLTNGMSSIQSASNKLTDGAYTLDSGASALSEGMTKFDNEGIETICSYINKNLKDVSVRLEKLQDLANEYNNFSSLADNSSGKVKFIMIMDAIKETSENKEDAIIDKKID